MKLGSLKSAIRSTKGSPMLRVELATGAVVDIAMMKGSLQEALDRAFPGGKSFETGLTLAIDGENAVLRPEGCEISHYALASAPPAPEPAPLLDLMEAHVAPVLSLLDDLRHATPAGSIQSLLV